MNTNRLKEELRRDEGVVYEIYLDHLGYKTFGVGHLVTHLDREFEMPVGAKITPERVEEAFEDDLENAIKETRSLFGYSQFDELPEEVQHVLVNMMFNLGYHRLKMFRKMRRAIKFRDWKEAAKEMRNSLWYSQVGNRSKRLVEIMENI